MKFWEIKNELNSEKAELLIYKEIANEDWWDEGLATPKKFNDELKALGGKDLVVRINSCGGDVFAAQSIYNQLKRYAGRVTITIDGIAASAATIIACAGENVIMPSNTIYMIHNPMNLLIGFYNQNELEEVAKALKAVKQTIVNVYKMKCKDKITDEKLSEMMDEETFLTAQEAKDYGFVDEIDDENSVTGVLNKGNLVINSIAFNAKTFNNPDKILEIMHKENNMENKKHGIMNKLQDMVNNFSNKNNDEVIAKAKQEERERITALNKLRVPNNETINNLVDEAIADETATADKVKPYLDKIAENIGAKDYVQNMISDVNNSGVNNVLGNEDNNISEEDKTLSMLSQASKNYLKNKFGGK